MAAILGAPKVLLESSSAIGDALVCARHWDDPLVYGELRILLGPDDQSAQQYVQSIRQRLVQNYIRAPPLCGVEEIDFYE